MTNLTFFKCSVVAVQSCSHVQLFVTPWIAACQASFSFTISGNLFKLMSIELVMPSNHLIIRCPLLLPSVFSSIRAFSNESALCIRWPKYQSFSISPSSEYSGLISFRIDQFGFLAVHGALKSLLSQEPGVLAEGFGAGGVHTAKASRGGFRVSEPQFVSL